jgi:hypothetical protein
MKTTKLRKVSTTTLLLTGLVMTPVVSVITSAPVSAAVTYGEQVTPTGWHDPNGTVIATWETKSYPTGDLVSISVSQAMVGDSMTYNQLVGLNKGVGLGDGDITISKPGDKEFKNFASGNDLNYKFESSGLYNFSFKDANGNLVTMDIVVVDFDKTVQAVPDSKDIQPMLRVYNPNSGEHFYTQSIFEKDQLVKAGWNFEGISWNAPTKSKSPVYRLYNPNAGDHFYTLSSYERDSLVKVGWNDEGIGWYSDDEKSTPVYRAYNPNAVTGSHNYTTGAFEQEVLVKVGWRDEGIAWYGVNYPEK